MSASSLGQVRIVVVRISLHVSHVNRHFDVRALLLKRNVRREVHRAHGPCDGPFPSLVQVAARVVDAQLLVSRTSNARTRIDDIVVTGEEAKQGEEAHEEANDDTFNEVSIDGETSDTR